MLLSSWNGWLALDVDLSKNLCRKEAAMLRFNGQVFPRIYKPPPDRFVPLSTTHLYPGAWQPVPSGNGKTIPALQCPDCRSALLLDEYAIDSIGYVEPIFTCPGCSLQEHIQLLAWDPGKESACPT